VDPDTRAQRLSIEQTIWRESGSIRRREILTFALSPTTAFPPGRHAGGAVVEGRKLRAQVSGTAEPEPGVRSALQRFAVRAYRVTNERLLNRTVAELERLPVGQRVFISRIRRSGAIVEPEPGMVIRPGDVVAVMTHAQLLMARGAEIGPEVDDTGLLDFPAEALDAVVTNKAVAGKTLGELAAVEWSRGVFLQKLVRVG
jgi:putative transport protein